MRTKFERVRLSLTVTPELAKFIMDLAGSEGCTYNEIIRRGLVVLKTFQAQRALGRVHMGFVSDPTKLDAELVGILNVS